MRVTVKKLKRAHPALFPGTILSVIGLNFTLTLGRIFGSVDIQSLPFPLCIIALIGLNLFLVYQALK